MSHGGAPIDGPGSNPPTAHAESAEAVAPVRIPITGELDLHTFVPRELGTLIPAYLDACREQGIFEVRLIHGKGTGILRTTVQALLSRSPYVEGFRQGDENTGGWGATLVRLRATSR